MKTKKGYVISWYFPPINSSEGLCTFKLLKNSKYQYDVFTQKNNKSWSYDTNEDKMLSKNINTIFSEAANINDWVKDGVKYYNECNEKYDFIMSRSMAPESHEIALEIKKQHPKILWIASFGDPIDNNPYNKLNEETSPYAVKGKGILSLPTKYVLSPKRILKNSLWNYRDRRYKKNNTRIEQDKILQDEVLKTADIVIFNNEYQQEYMLDGYSDEIKSKALLLYHGYDIDFYDKKETKKDDKYVVSYLGHLDAIRNAHNFLKALTKMKESRPNLYEKLEINIYGQMANEDKLYIIDNDLCEKVKFKKPIKYFESLKVMQESDLLLLIDANLGSVLPKNIFYAAKLADYIGSGTNIFGITMQDGPSSNIIKDIGGITCSHSADDIYNTFVRILENKVEIKNEDKDKKYDIKTIAAKYDKAIEQKIK